VQRLESRPRRPLLGPASRERSAKPSKTHSLYSGFWPSGEVQHGSGIVGLSQYTGSDWPAVKPETRARSEPASAGDRALKNPITGSAGCCARTASGHVTTAPQSELAKIIGLSPNERWFSARRGFCIPKSPSLSWDDTVYSKGLTNPRFCDESR